MAHSRGVIDAGGSLGSDTSHRVGRSGGPLQSVNSSCNCWRIEVSVLRKMMHVALACILIVAVVASVTTLGNASAQDVIAATKPLALHPENSRYFLFKGQPTVLVTSAEHYGLLLNTDYDYEKYLDELAACGLNHSRVFNGTYREAIGSFNITNNPLSPTDSGFITPWQRVDKLHRDGSPIFDLTKWNQSYFTRLKNIVRAAADRDIVLELTLFSPMYTPEIWDINPMNVRNNVNKIGDCGSNQLLDGENEELVNVQTAFAKKMVAELLPFENVYLEICNEPYFGGVTDAWQRKIINAVVEKQKELGCRKLISVNVANKTKKIVEPHPAISIFNFHYCHPPVVLTDNADIKAVIGENETGFRGRADMLYRTEGWDFLVGGGALYNNLDYSFSPLTPDGTLAEFTSPGGGGRALRKQLGILKKTFDELPLLKLTPLAADQVSASDQLVASAIGTDDGQYLVYVHVALPGKVKEQPIDQFRKKILSATVEIDLPTGSYEVVQLQTKTGEKLGLPAIAVKQNEPATITLIDFKTDAAVLIRRSEN